MSIAWGIGITVLIVVVVLMVRKKDSLRGMWQRRKAAKPAVPEPRQDPRQEARWPAQRAAANDGEEVSFSQSGWGKTLKFSLGFVLILIIAGLGFIGVRSLQGVYNRSIAGWHADLDRATAASSGVLTEQGWVTVTEGHSRRVTKPSPLTRLTWGQFGNVYYFVRYPDQSGKLVTLLRGKEHGGHIELPPEIPWVEFSPAAGESQVKIYVVMKTPR